MSADDTERATATNPPVTPPAGDAQPGLLDVPGNLLDAARVAVGARLAAVGLTANGMSMLGLAATLGAAACLVRHMRSGAESSGPAMPLLAAAFLLTLAGAADLLDGTLARLSGRRLPVGAVLDSTLDRVGESAVWVALLTGFALHGNLTCTALSAVAMTNALLISYIKARAESEPGLGSAAVGYWQRPERLMVVVIACAVGHLPALAWQQAVFPALTAARRLAAVVRGGPPVRPGAGRSLQEPTPPKPRSSRRTVAYAAASLAHLAFLLFAPRLHPLFAGRIDPLRTWLAG